MDVFVDIVRNYYYKVEDFILDMTVDLAHDYLFLTQHFPIFYLISALIICFEVRRRNPNLAWYYSIGASYAITFSGRALAAWCMNRRPPLLSQPLYSITFCLIWFMMNASPGDFLYSFMNSKFMLLIENLIMGLYQVRESTHGVDMGLRSFPTSVVGSLLISMILISTEDALWSIFFPNSRSRLFNVTVIYRNILSALAYLTITQYPEYFSEYFDTTKETVLMTILAVVEILIIIDFVIFKFEGHGLIDISLLTYIAKLFPFQGKLSE